MMRIASEFGFTPASRSRISMPSPAEPTLFDALETSEPLTPEQKFLAAFSSTAAQTTRIGASEHL
jgi:phage terminase small subunit